MPQFYKKDIDVLKSFIYDNYYIHDSVIETFEFDMAYKKIMIRMANSFYHAINEFSFEEVKGILFICGNRFGRNAISFGSNETIYSLSVEEDDSKIKSCMKPDGESLQDCLHLELETILGSQLHIIARKISAISAVLSDSTDEL